MNIYRAPLTYTTSVSGPTGGSSPPVWRRLSDRLSAYRHYAGWRIHQTLRGLPAVDHRRIARGATPVLINNFNRLAPLRELVDWLLALDEPVAVLIADNDSTYPPLLAYYDALDDDRVQVLRVGYNACLFALPNLARQLERYPYFALTDPDLVPVEHMPSDALAVLRDRLLRHPEINHVGFSIETEDLPAHYPLRRRVIEWERQFWRKPYKAPSVQVAPSNTLAYRSAFAKTYDASEPIQAEASDVPTATVDAFDAPIDTTFALYRNSSDVREVYRALRLGRPYTLRHVDWHEHPDMPSPEYSYYLAHCRPIATWAAAWVAAQQR